MDSVGARNKDNMDKNEVNRIKQNGPEHVAAAEVKAKKMKLASTLYDNAASTINNLG